MSDWQTHEARSQELADSVRRYLIAAHTGGIATTFALAGSLASNQIHPKWAFAPVFLFAVGLVLAGISMLLAQHREMRRRDAAKVGEPDPTFAPFWWSWVWNWTSLTTFIAAVVTALCLISTLPISCA